MSGQCPRGHSCSCEEEEEGSEEGEPTHLPWDVLTHPSHTLTPAAPRMQNTAMEARPAVGTAATGKAAWHVHCPLTGLQMVPVAPRCGSDTLRGMTGPSGHEEKGDGCSRPHCSQWARSHVLDMRRSQV